MRFFHLVRTEDETGVSGTGIVAEGVVFGNGWVAMRWLSARPSMALFSTIDDVEAVHGHEGKTTVFWGEESQP